LSPATQPILYVRLPNWVGDVCMSLPSLDALRATDLPLVVCARAWARDFLAAYPLAGFVVMEASWRQNRKALLRSRAEFRGHRPLGLLLPDSLSSALSFRFAGIPSAGYRDDGRSLLLRWPIRKPAQALHAVQAWHHLTRQALMRWQLQAPPVEPAAELHWMAAESHGASAMQALARTGLATGRFVLIAPTATGLHKGQVKVWPHFDALTRALQARGHTVVMAPPAGEQAAARHAVPTATLLPALGLGAFTVLTRLAALVICNDSGVSHLAAAAGAQQITLFGVTQPARTGPWSNKAQRLGQWRAWPTLDEVLSNACERLAGTPSSLHPTGPQPAG